MKTVASIARTAFDKVDAKIGGVIHDCTQTRVTGGSANRVTGVYTPGTATDTGRLVVLDAQARESFFPGLVLEDQDLTVMIIEISDIKETDTITFLGKSYSVLRQVDVVKGGGLFAAHIRAQ